MLVSDPDSSPASSTGRPGRSHGLPPRRTSRSTPTCFVMSARSSGRTSSSPGGKRHDVPAHHRAEEAVDAYVAIWPRSAWLTTNQSQSIRAPPPGRPRGPTRRALRTLTEITLLCAERPKPQKTGSAWMHLATLYRSLSLVLAHTGGRAVRPRVPPSDDWVAYRDGKDRRPSWVHGRTPSRTSVNTTAFAASSCASRASARPVDPVAVGRVGDVGPAKGAHLAPPHPGHKEEPRPGLCVPRPGSARRRGGPGSTPARRLPLVLPCSWSSTRLPAPVASSSRRASSPASTVRTSELFHTCSLVG